MSIARLNQPTDDRASGITAPLIRAASHVGYVIGYLEEMTEEHWEEHRDELFEEVKNELNEAISHLRDSTASRIDNAFISAETQQMLTDLRVNIDAMRVTAPVDRGDLIRDLQATNHNIAFAGARLDRDTAGLEAAHEGILT